MIFFLPQSMLIINITENSPVINYYNHYLNYVCSVDIDLFNLSQYKLLILTQNYSAFSIQVTDIILDKKRNSSVVLNQIVRFHH